MYLHIFPGDPISIEKQIIDKLYLLFSSLQKTSNLLKIILHYEYETVHHITQLVSNLLETYRNGIEKDCPLLQQGKITLEFSQ